jgi:putative endonuclease
LDKPEVTVTSGLSLQAMTTVGKPYWVYVLRSKTRRCFYVGVSENPEARLTEHNAGISTWTRGKGPWEKVWQREFVALSEARKFENLLKRQKGGKGFYALTGLQPEERKS